MPFSFKVQKRAKDCLARAGKIETAHGVIETPAFVVVGTKGTVKALTPERVASTGAQAVLANTYHLYLQPGADLVRRAGGLGKFMNWVGPTMTDSGGFQVFSLGAAYGRGISKLLKPNSEPILTEPVRNILNDEDLDSAQAKLVRIDENGVMFRSHLDGSAHYFTPERSIEIQHDLGADIIFAFDECTSPLEPFAYQRQSLDRTHRWAKRSLEQHHELLRSNLKNLEVKGSTFVPALFGIIQGGREKSLREEGAKIISEMRVKNSAGEEIGFDGYSIGGSFDKEDLHSAVAWVNAVLPEDKPRHLLGIGEPEDLFAGVENGVDTFDCVIPTRLARHGTVQTARGKLNLDKEQYRDDLRPIEEGCACYACALQPDGTPKYSRAYLAHLFRAKEMLAATLASVHNLYFTVNLVKQVRQAIIADIFRDFKKEFSATYRTLGVQ